MRDGLGPVFWAEWITSTRRWQMYAIRSLFVLCLMLGLWGVYVEVARGQTGLNIASQARVGQSFYVVTSIILLGLVGLAAPAATAGSICQEKGQGNLALLFTTDVTDREIVLGKLAARLVPVLGLLGCTMPVLALATLLGGVDPVHVVGVFLVLLAMAVFGATLAMTFSVWGTRMHEVLVATYLFGVGWVCLAPIAEVMRSSIPWLGFLGSPVVSRPLLLVNPIYLAIEPMNQSGGRFPGVGLAQQATFLGMSVVVSVLLIWLCIARLRRVVVRQSGRAERARTRRSSRWGDGIREWWRRLPGPSLDGNPVMWREWHRRRPSRLGLWLWGGFALASGLFGLMAFVMGLTGGRQQRDFAAVINGMIAIVGLLLLSIPAATSLAEERQRGSLDVLLTTPLSTRSIVWGKWWGAFRGAIPLAMLATLIAAALSMHTGPSLQPLLVGGLVLAYGAALASFGLAQATWHKNMGRAVGMTTGGYVVVAIGAVPIAMLLFGRQSNQMGQGLAAMSPFWGVGFYSALLGGTGGRASDLFGQSFWMAGWIVLFSMVAAGLVAATIATFNRCLGRMNDWSDRFSAWVVDREKDNDDPAGSWFEPVPEVGKSVVDGAVD